jgi:hypothetical protein
MGAVQDPAQLVKFTSLSLRATEEHNSFDYLNYLELWRILENQQATCPKSIRTTEQTETAKTAKKLPDENIPSKLVQSEREIQGSLTFRTKVLKNFSNEIVPSGLLQCKRILQDNYSPRVLRRIPRCSY